MRYNRYVITPVIKVTGETKFFKDPLDQIKAFEELTSAKVWCKALTYLYGFCANDDAHVLGVFPEYVEALDICNTMNGNQNDV